MAEPMLEHEEVVVSDTVKFRFYLLVRALFVVLLPVGAAVADEPARILQGAKRIVFLGASNTYSGHYVALVAARLRLEAKTRRIECVNVGLPSETVSGLSEPDHPFPRPDLHERLDRVLAKLQPDVVVATYGMNDAIYYPFSAERFAAFKGGMRRLVDKVKRSGAKLVLLTPAAFDPEPMRRQGKLRGGDAEKFAWFAIYEGYDTVMRRYADWLLEQKSQVDIVVDVHKAFTTYLTEERKKDPDFVMSDDGVHFDKSGHRVVAAAVLKAWGFSPPTAVDEDLLQLVAERQEVLRNAWIADIGHKRPGVKKGLPLSEANERVAVLERRISSLLER